MTIEPVASRLFTQTVIEHERTLSGSGEVLVSVGQWVQSDDVIARGLERGGLRVVDAAQALGVACHRLGRYLRVAVGQEVRAKEVLAADGFMGWRTVRTPVAGRVAEIASGRIFIQELERQSDLRALLPGQVVRILPGRGAVIRATVSRVVGIWGTGGDCFQPLVLLSPGPADPLHWTGIDDTCRGKIVAGGQCLDGRVLQRAAELEVQGLVVGGLAEHLRARAEELGLVVVVTDALGAVPMAGPVFELLAQHDGSPALLTTTQGDGPPGLPVLDIPLQAVRGPVNVAPERPLAVGDRVRVTRPPYLGTTGWVQAIVEQDGEVWVKVNLDRGASAHVAYRNLERLG